MLNFFVVSRIIIDPFFILFRYYIPHYRLFSCQKKWDVLLSFVFIHHNFNFQIYLMFEMREYLEKVFLRLIMLLFLIGAVGCVAETSKNNYFNFYIEKFNIKMELPETTSNTGDYYNNEQVLFSSFLSDQALKYWGYIQVWKISDLDDFLKNSKSNSVYQFTYYNQYAINVNNLDGLETDWSAIMQSKRQLVAKEIFLRKPNSDEVLRVSFFTEGKEIPSNLNQTYSYIVSSITWK